MSTHVSIHVINDRCSVIPHFPPFKRIIYYIFPIRLSVRSCFLVRLFNVWFYFVWLPVCLISYLSSYIYLFWFTITWILSLKYSSLFTYLSLCSFLPFHCIGIVSIGSTKLENLSMILQNQGQLQISVSRRQLKFKDFFNSIKFYTSVLKVFYLLVFPVKGNLIHK